MDWTVCEMAIDLFLHYSIEYAGLSIPRNSQHHCVCKDAEQELMYNCLAPLIIALSLGSGSISG